MTDFAPTTVPPGSGKVEVLRQRVEQGFPLWHPDDNRAAAPLKKVESSGCSAKRGFAVVEIESMEVLKETFDRYAAYAVHREGETVLKFSDRGKRDAAGLALREAVRIRSEYEN